MKKSILYSLIIILLLCIACALQQIWAHYKVAAYEKAPVEEIGK